MSSVSRRADTVESRAVPVISTITNRIVSDSSCIVQSWLGDLELQDEGELNDEFFTGNKI